MRFPRGRSEYSFLWFKQKNTTPSIWNKIKKNEWGISSLKVTWSSRVCMGTCNQKSGSIFVSLCKNIPAGKAKRKQSLIQTFYETSAAHCLIDWHLPNQPTKITSFACFSSMQIFHAWEKCRLADLKNSFYLLIFSAKNKTVSTITFNFLRD